MGSILNRERGLEENKHFPCTIFHQRKHFSEGGGKCVCVYVGGGGGGHVSIILLVIHNTIFCSSFFFLALLSKYRKKYWTLLDSHVFFSFSHRGFFDRNKL